MKQLMIAALLVTHAFAAPGMAATLDASGTALQTRPGAFAGARLRIGLGGRERGQVRAGLAIAPTLTGRFEGGRVSTAFGEGFEFGVRGDGPAGFAIGGRAVDGRRLGAEGGKGGGIPTWALIAGGAVLVLGIAAAVSFDALSDASE